MTLDRVVRTLGCPFEVTTDDRPSFKFGDGRSLRAVSRVKFLTAALGWLSFYILDDPEPYGGTAAQDTPLLLGGRVLRSLEAILSYSDNMMTFKKPGSNELAALQLHPTKNGHLA